MREKIPLGYTIASSYREDDCRGCTFANSCAVSLARASACSNSRNSLALSCPASCSLCSSWRLIALIRGPLVKAS
jgi:hypothetical protein